MMIATRRNKARALEALKRAVDLSYPEEFLWFAVLARAFKDIGTKKHLPSFWDPENLRFYEIILGISCEYMLNTLQKAGIDISAVSLQG